MVSVPLALGGAILGTQIMAFIFGAAYVSGGLSFKILMITMLVDYPVTIIGTAIFAYNRQRGLIVASLIGGVGNVIFDLMLIPRFGITGSAIATLLAQFASNWYLWHMMKKINYFEVVPKLGKIVTSGIGMAIVVATLFFFHANVVVNIAIGAAVYLGLLVFLREPLLVEAKRIIAPKPIETAA